MIVKSIEPHFVKTFSLGASLMAVLFLILFSRPQDRHSGEEAENVERSVLLPVSNESMTPVAYHSGQGTELHRCHDPQCCPGAVRDHVVEQHTIQLDLPQGQPEHFSVLLPFRGKELELDLVKHSVRSENVRVLMSDGRGGLQERSLPPVNTYVGTLEDYPEIFLGGHLTEEGLELHIEEDFGETWSLKPSSEGVRAHLLAKLEIDPTLGNPDALRAHECQELESLADDLSTATQGFAPLNFIQGKRAEMAFDLDYEFARRYLNHDGSNPLSQVQRDEVAANALSQAENLVLTRMNPRFERSYAVSWEVGTIIVREQIADDPYRGTEGSVTFNVARNIWVFSNNPPSDTFDTIVTGHGGGLGGGVSGLAANNVAANTASSLGLWRGTSLHEVHHNWGHPHGIGRGSDLTPWGKWISPSMIIGSETSKANYDESRTTLANKASRGSSLENKVITVDAPPYPALDVDAFVEVGAGNSVLIDVLANDHDANNDQVRILNKFSSNSAILISNGNGNGLGIPRDDVVFSSTTVRGGTVELVPGVSGQRDQIRYTPPTSTNATFDAFHYYVVDNSGAGGSDGQEDFGMVKVGLVKPTVVSENDDLFRYDAGPASAHVQSGQVPLSPHMTGDVFWSTKPSAADRFVDNDGGGSLNQTRDLLTASGSRTLNHKVSNGIWEVTVQMGDRDARRQNQAVAAEGILVISDLDADRARYPTETFVIEVIDGELNLEFNPQGGRWVLNYLQLKKLSGEVIVDTNARSFAYDFGTVSSPVSNGLRRITGVTSGDISWSQNVISIDRGDAADDRDRDFIASTETVTFRHQIASGQWDVSVIMGDQDEARDQMQVRAEEGQVVRQGIESSAGQYAFVSFQVEVTDGFLDLEFSDQGGNANGWAVNALVVTAATIPREEVTVTEAVSFSVESRAQSFTLANFDPSGAEKLVVTVSGEGSEGALSRVTSITFDGLPLTEIINGRDEVQFSSIWYLDGPPSSVSDIVVNWSDNVGGSGIGAFGLLGARPGAPTRISAEGALSTSLAQVDENSVVISSFVANGGTRPTVSSPHMLLYGEPVGSAVGAAASFQTMNTGPVTVTYATNATRPVTLMAAFGPSQVPAPFAEINGTVSMEAEHFSILDARGNTPVQWSFGSLGTGFSGAGYMTVPDGNDLINMNFSFATRMTYEVDFSTIGTYRVYVRRMAFGGSSNSVFAAFGEDQTAEVDNGSDFEIWTWVDLGTVVVTETGVQDFNIGLREDGYQVDKIVLTTGAAPNGNGPAESLRVDVDSDGDGLPDVYEFINYGDFTANADASSDLDGDGSTDVLELIAGTDPANARSIFQVTDVTENAGELIIQWASVPGKIYTIFQSADLSEPLSSWTPVLNDIEAVGASTSRALPLNNTVNFYAVSVEE